MTSIKGAMLSWFNLIYEIHKTLNCLKWVAEFAKDEKTLDMSRFLLTMTGFLIRSFWRFLGSEALKKLSAKLSAAS